MRNICANFCLSNKPPLPAKNTVNHTYNVRTPDAYDNISDTVSWAKYLKECVATLFHFSNEFARFIVHTLEDQIIKLLTEKYGRSKKFLSYMVEQLLIFTRDDKSLVQLVTDVEHFISGTDELVMQCGTMETLNHWPVDAKVTREAVNKDRQASFFIHNVNPLLMHIENCAHIVFGRKLGDAATFLNSSLNATREAVIGEMEPMELAQLEERVKMYEYAIKIIHKIREDIRKIPQQQQKKGDGLCGQMVAFVRPFNK